MENIVADALSAAGHQIAAFESVKNSETPIRSQLVGFIEDPDVDMVIVVGDGHAISKALSPLVDQPLPGFADLLRMLAFQEIGASAMLSTAEAARCGSTFVFVLPVGEAAVRAAMDKLILPQLDPSTQPKNLISEMPRFKEEGEFTRVDNEPAEEAAVPMAIVKEKTASGAGLVPRLPAKAADPIPAPAQRNRPATQSRIKSATGKNVIVRKVEDPTKPIELQKLEKQIELSKTTGDSTKPVELSRLPKLPPGASSDLGEQTMKSPPAPSPANEAVTKIAPPPERPVTSAPVGRAKQATPAKPLAVPDRARLTPAMATPIVKPAIPIASAKGSKKAALIVEDASEVQPTTQRPRPKTAPPAAPPKPVKPPIQTEELEPIEAEELETIERPSPVKTPSGAPAIIDLAALDNAAADSNESGTHQLGTSEIEPLDAEAERATLERLLPAEAKPEPKPDPVKRPPTQPPPPPEPVKRPPTQPPPIAKPPVVELPLPPSPELPAGSFDYSAGDLRRSKMPLILLLLVVAGLAVGAFVLLKGRKSGESTPDAAVVANDPPPTPDAAVVVATPDALDEIEMEPIDAGVVADSRKRNPPRTNDTRPRPTTPDPKPDTKPDTRPETPPDKPDETKPEPADPGCDEPTCVIEKYARPCCAKFKPTGEGFTPGAGDSLDKPQIRAGIDRMKPAISRCGEQHPAKGTVKVSVSVNPDGVVTSADVVTAPDAELGKCVAGFVRKATFAKTVNGGSFSYPFVF